MSGALLEQTYLSGRVVKNPYDTADGSLSQVQSKRSSETYRNFANGFIYNAAGAVTAMRLGNGKWENTVFNSRLQPTQIGLGNGVNSQNLLKLQYEYGATASVNNGNVTKQTITVPGVANPFVQTYSYDELNRLKNAEEIQNSTQTWEQTFTYDRFGNRNFNEAETTTLPKNCGTAPSLTVCAADKKIVNPSVNTANNRLSTSDDYAFDSSGNTTRDAESRRFTYDAENKQTKVETLDGNRNPIATVGEYSYDGDGKRIKKYVPDTGETTVFVYDASGKLIQEYSTIVQPAQDAKTVYTTNDHLGSPRINTDGTGQVISRHDYHPFGEEVDRTSFNYGSDTIRKQFTGYERDSETGLDFAQARYFSAPLGRFLVPDSFLGSGRIHMPQSWNRFAYVLGNPIKSSDPTGMYEYAEGTSDEDKKRIRKAYDALVKASAKFKEGSKKYRAINRALTALGAPGEKNGVTIYVDNSQSAPGDIEAGYAIADGKATGKAEVYIGLNLSKFTSGDSGAAALAGTLGHEGSHAADYQYESAKLTGMTFDEVSAKSGRGEIMSRAETEVRAYRISSYVAEAISPSDVQSVGFNGYEVWNRSWSEADRDKNREKGIRGVLEAPGGSYRFRYVPHALSFPMPFLNNSLDDKSSWKNNGGPIIK